MKISAKYWESLLPHEKTFIQTYGMNGNLPDVKRVVKIARTLFPNRADIVIKPNHIEADGLKHYFVYYDGAYPPEIVFTEPAK